MKAKTYLLSALCIVLSLCVVHWGWASDPTHITIESFGRNLLIVFLKSLPPFAVAMLLFRRGRKLKIGQVSLFLLVFLCYSVWYSTSQKISNGRAERARSELALIVQNRSAGAMELKPVGFYSEKVFGRDYSELLQTIDNTLAWCNLESQELERAIASVDLKSLLTAENLQSPEIIQANIDGLENLQETLSSSRESILEKVSQIERAFSRIELRNANGYSISEGCAQARAALLPLEACVYDRFYCLLGDYVGLLQFIKDEHESISSAHDEISLSEEKTEELNLLVQRVADSTRQLDEATEEYCAYVGVNNEAS
jgi:hypothetical protein